jgi:hypothetical protein
VELYLHSPNKPSRRDAQLKAQGQLYRYPKIYGCADFLASETTEQLITSLLPQPGRALNDQSSAQIIASLTLRLISDINEQKNNVHSSGMRP